MDIKAPSLALEACEKSLRKAAGDALEAGEYGTARQIMAWAENVAAMLVVARSPSAREKSAWAPDALEAGSRPRGVAKARMLEGGDEYPRFMRRGDELVKIAWSKSDRAEYSHRAPRRSLEAVVTRLNVLGSKGEAFGSEDLSPLKDARTGGIFPTYQIFVALAWLRKLGLVHQEGRKSGYTLDRHRSLDEVIATAWPQLPAV